MPTDPFVAPDPADRPRQQQNLPPGLALPPSRGRRGPRPGDLGPRQPRGMMLGAPGPNVGYAYTLAQRGAPELRLGAHEHASDVVAVVAEIASKRAALFGRAPVIGDVDVAVTLLGYDGSADDDFVETRTLIVYEAGRDYTRRRTVVDAVPEQLLQLKPAELDEHVGEWRTLTVNRLAPPAG